jgi:hypothetical protein
MTEKIEEYRSRYFALATSCKPADRARAEKAALRMSDISEIKTNTIHCVNNSIDARLLWGSLSDSLSEVLWEHLMDLLKGSLWEPLRGSLREVLWISPGESMGESLSESLRESLWIYLRKSLSESLCETLRESSLRELLRVSLRELLGESLWDSLGESRWASVSDSLWNSLRTSDWFAFYSFCVDELKIKIDDSTHGKLRLHNDIAASCFALWMVPGTIILCERPKSVEIIDGRLVNITEWRK